MRKPLAEYMDHSLIKLILSLIKTRFSLIYRCNYVALYSYLLFTNLNLKIWYKTCIIVLTNTKNQTDEKMYHSCFHTLYYKPKLYDGSKHLSRRLEKSRRF